MIINEPDVWMVNLLTKTGQHIVDSGPTFNCRMPIFHGDQIKSAGDMKDPLLELEFGRELAYFKGKGAPPKEGPVLQGRSTTAYATEVGGSHLYLFTTDTPERPWALVREHENIREIFWYSTHEQLPFDRKLFTKPEGVVIEEAKQ